MAHLKSQYPWASAPFVANAAMGGFAGSKLATAVSLAGGIGFIGAVNDMKALEGHLESAAAIFKSSERQIQAGADGLLPLGVGFLPFAVKLEEATAVISRHKPAIIWLACPKTTGDFKPWVEAMRAASPGSLIWIQVASVSVAVGLAKECSPDVLVMQGSDAGGHGPFPGAGIVSLVPETRDALDEAGHQDIAVFASGGIVDGRGVAAALACGAAGAVLGTRFLASREIDMPAEEYRDAVLAARDGGISTVRGTVFDELRGKSIWPAGYDGRALAGPSYSEFQAGASIEEIQSRYAEAAKEAHKGFGGDVRGAVWAGSGVGLVKEVKGSAEIVRELQEDTRKALSATASYL